MSATASYPEEKLYVYKLLINLNLGIEEAEDCRTYKQNPKL